jgi:4-hydroxybenzoate polyprenyltransferase/phosphoserine phosphatase
MSSPPEVIGGRNVPLCVDLDGTLTPIDTLHEALLGLARQAPRTLIHLPFWLRLGKARMKREVAAHFKFNAADLPLNRPLLEWLRAERESGRYLVLATAADSSVAEQVAARIGLFDKIIASDGRQNLSADAKCAALVENFGERGFDYVGNERADEPAWRAARKAIVVGTLKQAERTRRIADVERVFINERAGVRVWIKAMRVHQWVKNMLIFLPAILAHRILDPAILLQSVAAFFAFGLCASSVYLINDLLDLSVDRNHPRKCQRPLASGVLSARNGLVMAVTLICASAALAVFVSLPFAGVLCGYYVLTWTYSLRLKRAALVDVMTLAGLYTIRIIAGAAATSIQLSFWLLAFSVFIFLSLGLVKRYTEINDGYHAGKLISHGRGYSAADLPLLMSLGVASGFCTVVVMALYINSTDSQALYRHNKPLWLVCPLLLYWLSRVWLLTTRAQMHDDPVVFALRDRISLVVLALLGFIVLVSI